MIKRTALVIVAAGVLALLAAPLPARAQFRERASRPIGLYVDIGYLNVNSAPRWVAIGPELELRLGKALTVNPELTFWFRDFLASKVHVVPGGTVNLRLNAFFIGGGVVRRISEWTDSASGTVVPKFQAGYAPGPIRLSVYVLLLNRTDTFVLGLNFGFRI